MEYTERVKEIISGIESLSSKDIWKSLEKELNTRITVYIGKNKIYGDKAYTCRIKIKGIIICSEYNVLRANYNYIAFAVSIIKEKMIIERLTNLCRNAAKSALEGLTAKEAEGVGAVFKEIDGNSALIVTKDIADKNNITRSVILNGLRKLECAGLIEMRSKGTKGTEIKILYQEIKEAVLKNVSIGTDGD